MQQVDDQTITSVAESKTLSESFCFGESIETPEQHKAYLRNNEFKYRKYFKNFESYETFMMLPLDEKGRRALLEKMIEEERTRSMMPLSVVYGAT